MIRHIAMFHLTEAAEAKGKDAVIAEIKQSVANMNGKIPGLVKAEIGVNFAGGPHDIVMYCEFENREAAAGFGEHPLHVAHREKMKEYVSDRVFADYEIDG